MQGSELALYSLNAGRQEVTTAKVASLSQPHALEMK